jgi:hypothetical protein
VLLEVCEAVKEAAACNRDRGTAFGFDGTSDLLRNQRAQRGGNSSLVLAYLCALVHCEAFGCWLDCRTFGFGAL